MSKPRKLTARQQRYVDEYVADRELNQERAAIKAGYSAHSAKTSASQLMRKPAVEAAITEAMRRRSERTGVSADRVLQELARVGYFDIGQACDAHGRPLPLQQMPEDTRRALSSVEVETLDAAKVAGPLQLAAQERLRQLDDGAAPPQLLLSARLTKIKSSDKVRALELLGKHLKLFTEKHEHAGADGAPLGVVILPAEKD